MSYLLNNDPYQHLRTPAKGSNPSNLTDIEQKVSLSILEHVYSQTILAIFASLFCATLVFFGIWATHRDLTYLYYWYGIFGLITIIRIISVLIYRNDHRHSRHIAIWRKIYIIGSALGGLSWGLSAISIFPNADPIQQMLIIFMLAGVTAGVVSLSSIIPSSAIAFLLGSCLPYLVVIAFLNQISYQLFDIALVLYIIYSIILIVRTFHLIHESIILKFQNDTLLIDLTNAKKALEIINQKLKIAATHDSLTKVANRRLFEFNIREAIERARKNSASFALLYIDLDNFKKLNDRYGHQFGDQVLVELTQRLIQHFGTDEPISRLGGDEFIVILEDIADAKQAEVVAEQICKIGSQPFKLDNLDINISLSIGISIYPVDGINVESLLKKADERVYCVKQSEGSHYFKLSLS